MKPDPRPPVGRDLAAFHVAGDVATPTPHAAGPWFAEQQHGASVFGLLTRFVDQVPSAAPMRLTRLTADMSRPIPMEPCSVRTTILRDGRRVQSLAATVEHEGTVVARAFATRIRIEPGLVPAALVHPRYPEDEPPPFPASGQPFGFERPSFHDCLEVRAQHRTDDGTRSVFWYRLAHPLVAGEEPTPVVRVAAVADMVNSSAARLGPDWMSINPELSLQLEREPEGEWIAVDTTVRLGDDGVGASEAVLSDRRGRIGRSAKSVLNVERPA